MSDSQECQWDVLVITCKTQQLAKVIQKHFDVRKQQGWFPKDLTVLCFEDPQDGMGSGGATLNALLTMTEYLSAQKGFTVVTSDVLKSLRVLMMHTGRFFPFDACSHGFVCLPLVPVDGESEFLVTNFDALYHLITYQLLPGSPPGLWVCSCDMLLSFPLDYKLDWANVDVGDGIIGFSVPATIQYAGKHGVYVLDDDGAVKDLIYQGSPEILSNVCFGDSTVSLVSGIVFFSKFATERLLTTHVTSPLDACTYLGIDSGMEAVGISLYFDILLATASDINETEYVTGKRSGAFGKCSEMLTGGRKQYMKNARSVLWKHIHDLTLKVVLIKEGKHCYLDMQQTPNSFCGTLRQFCPSIHGFNFSLHVHSSVHEEANVNSSALLINSIIEEGSTVGENSTIVHSHLTGGVAIGKHCYVYGLDEKSCHHLLNSSIPDNSFVIGISVEFKQSSVKRLFACLPSNAELFQKQSCFWQNFQSMAAYTSELQDLILNLKSGNIMPFSYRQALANQEHLEEAKPLFMAKIFPTYHLKFDVNVSHAMFFLSKESGNVACKTWFDFLRSSLCEMLENVNYCSELEYQQTMNLAVSSRRINCVLTTNHNVSLLPLFKSFVTYEKPNLVLSLLDNLAIEAVKHPNESERRPDISARAFACTADVLGFMAGNKGGLRSGPAANKQWKKPLDMLQKGNMLDGVATLSKVREKWLHHPDLLIRAARHYEGAEQILIRHAVMSVSTYIHTYTHMSLANNFWYISECPARIDISGGWTDTPPICYEFGGSVVNAAILLNGKRPIGARMRRLDSCVVRLTLLGHSEAETQHIECTALDHFRDYNVPQAPGALLKACFVLSQIVDLNSSISLHDQLKEQFQGGFELQTWSNLPRGSGVGTSSILAAAVLRVVYEASGKVIDQDSLIHAVLLVEQMMTTGGGWQDQVGGIVGGFKIGRSAPKIPLQVTTDCLLTSDSFYETFSDRLKLIYTGKTRLARNLLQNVVRNWYTKRSDILNTCHRLKENAEECAKSIEAENLERIGEHMNAYWEQKKSMAFGCEPDLCRRMINKLRPYTLGVSLAGAGGGGFMYVLTNASLSNDFITTMLKEVDGAQDAVVYDAKIDRIGMVYYRQPF